MAYIAFGEIIDIYSIIGVVLIICSTLFMLKTVRIKKNTNGGSGKS